ncbi:hypothetical protein L873DRAFT_1821028 [Choiromyces venosus 120613-1]|uniref:Uncharacterized protein n=1 Tax=Choiromyces venosus 120613-1 TaxID=1336337 RepID=A0A3N4IX36_9PEZI|nr:hypothetical protein L873DRAFT_1821028 [Choiromyces venosus 120613-1]
MFLLYLYSLQQGVLTTHILCLSLSLLDDKNEATGKFGIKRKIGHKLHPYSLLIPSIKTRYFPKLYVIVTHGNAGRCSILVMMPSDWVIKP